MGRLDIGVLFERKCDFPEAAGVPPDADSELLSAQEEAELLEGLDRAGFRVRMIGDCDHLVEHLADWRTRCDIVFNRSVGYKGVERKAIAASVLEAARIPYIGSTPYTLELSRNKYHAKLVAAAAGTPTRPSVLLHRESPRSVLDKLPYPAIVKPNCESSSIGVSERGVVGSPDEAFEYAMKMIGAYRQPAIVEAFVPGLELEVPVIADPDFRALGVCAVKINGAYVDSDRILSSEVVYADGYEYDVPPAGLDIGPVEREAVRVAAALGFRDYGRVDFRLPADGSAIFIECSTHPHLQRGSSFHALAARLDISYPEMLKQIVEAGLARYDLLRSRPYDADPGRYAYATATADPGIETERTE